MSGESPSPFVLTAPLIPPCAQTEWLRLTGTIEKRSTPIPISAARTAVMRPARPPPTMMIRSFSAISTALQPERLDAPDADVRQDQEDDRRDVHHPPLRLRADRQAPDDRERPDTVGEVVRGRENPRQV